VRVFYSLSPDPRVASFNELVTKNFPDFLTEDIPEVILVAGGDGAMHHATKKFPDFKGVYVGKGLGNLNFLMNIIEDDLATLGTLVQGNLCEITNYTMTATTQEKNFLVTVADIPKALTNK